MASPSEDVAPSLTGIVPRWEWRTFGASFEAADARFAELTPDRVQESDEIYVLSLESDASVKVRDGLMDVKQLEHVNEDGLEQWRPVMKASFPLAASDAASLLSALGLDLPPLAREEYTLDELVAEIGRSTDSVRTVKVHKHRDHFMPGGCMAEVTEVRTESGSTRTIAIESEDPGLVIATVRDFGLGSRANVCLARGLKTLVGFEALRYGVIDVGTNSVKFHVGEHRPNGEWRTIIDRAEITRLGEGLAEDGRLQPEPIRRTVDAIAAMVDEARRNGAGSIAAVGTAGLRIASNSAELVDAVQQRCGVGIEVIPGEEEARLAYLAATSELEVGRGSLAVFDTGGGSSQFTFGRQGRVDEQFSENVGAARFTERFGLGGAVTEEVLQEALDAMAADLASLDGRSTPDAVVGLGGAVTNLAAVKHELAAYDPDVVQGTVLDRSEIDRQIELYRTRSADERREIVGLQPKRAEVILAGACIVRTVLGKLGCESLTVSDRGLRHGLIVERFGSR
jgi:exopolyphosphatase/guanosine-5'-triphosphate,3'-diphosphate pyrophosphatase